MLTGLFSYKYFSHHMSTNLEIERKFIVNTNHPEYQRICASILGQRLIQSTIHKESGYKLRIRMIEDIATGARSSFFCFKVSREKNKKTDPSMRDEYEWPVLDRNALYMMIGHGEITKLRREWIDIA
jgi:CYTH domain-containing protein